MAIPVVILEYCQHCGSALNLWPGDHGELCAILAWEEAEFFWDLLDWVETGTMDWEVLHREGGHDDLPRR